VGSAVGRVDLWAVVDVQKPLSFYDKEFWGRAVDLVGRWSMMDAPPIPDAYY
jgi:hypothetical protein